MKTKRLLVIVAVFAALLSNVCAYAGEQQHIASDNYRPMLVDGRTWNMMSITGSYADEPLVLDTTYFSYTFEIAGDTIIEGRPCYKTKNNEYAYESDGKVYWYGKGGKKNWVLMYDFNLKVGDMFYQDEIMKVVEYLIVSSIDTIQVKGQNYRRFRFAEMFNPYDGWVEGIGNIYSGPFFYPFMSVLGTMYVDYRCLSVYDGDECIFTFDDFSKPSYIPEVEMPAEYDYRETGSGEDLYDVNVGAPLIATKARSRAEILYKYENTRLVAGNLITQLTYKGYNPGEAFTRHFIVWMENTKQRDINDQNGLTPTVSMTKVFEGDCTIPSGGTADERIALLTIPLETPFMYDGESNSIRVVIESIGEAALQDVCFEHGKTKRQCFNATAEGESDNLEWEDAQFPLTTLTAATEVVYQTGQVLDQDGHPIPGAKVQMDSNASGYHIAYENSSSDDGKYSIRIGEGERAYRARVSAPGYASYIDNYAMLAKENPVRNFILRNAIYYKAGQQATIIMPIAPSASWGKYYRMDRMDGRQLIFERELSPKANEPYVIIPDMDFMVNLQDLDMSANPDTVTLAGWFDENRRYSYRIDFVGSYDNRNFIPTSNQSCLFYDNEAECGWEERVNSDNEVCNVPRIGTLHASLVVDASYDIEVIFHDTTSEGDPLYFEIEKIDHTVGVPPVLKTPPSAPTVLVNGSVLEFQGEHPAYTLNIVDNEGNTLFTTEVSESMMQVELPFNLTKDMEVNLLQGSWRIYGRLEPDHETVKVNGINNHPASPSAPVYDLQGRRIQGEPQKGVYLRNGRKYVRK